MPNYSMATIMRTHRVLKELMALTLSGHKDLNIGKATAALETWRERADIFADDLYIERLEVRFANNGQSLAVKVQWRLGIKLQPYTTMIVVSRAGVLEHSYQLNEDHVENSDLQDDEDAVDIDDNE